MTAEFWKKEDFPPYHEWTEEDCRKGHEFCYCATGYPYECKCPGYRDIMPKWYSHDSYCEGLGGTSCDAAKDSPPEKRARRTK